MRSRFPSRSALASFMALCAGPATLSAAWNRRQRTCQPVIASRGTGRGLEPESLVLSAATFPAQVLARLSDTADLDVAQMMLFCQNPMRHRPCFLLVLAASAAAIFASGEARAQTTTGSATVTASGQVVPLRFMSDRVTQLPQRPVNLNPTGINYSDCIQDTWLQFSVTLSGFDGSESMQIWATRSGDCTADTARGANGALTATCWLVNNGITGTVYQSPQTQTFWVRVQDLVGPQNTTPTLPVRLVSWGPSACSQQTSFVAVPMNIWFVPVNSAGLIDGTAYSYPINTDLVGPPPPAVNPPGVGDTLILASWTANIDADTGGYDVFIDPPPGSPADATAGGASAAVQLICPDASTPVDAGDDGSDGMSTDAPDEAQESAAIDAETDANLDASSSAPQCYYQAVSNPTTGAAPGCTSTALTSANVQDASAVTMTVVDEAGNILDSSVTSGTAGIATIPCQYLVGASCPSGTPVYNSVAETVSGEASTTYNLTGLSNGSLYNVVVSAVDNFGNVGPPSSEQCATPAPVDDFFKIYRQDGGGAGGGFCALDIMGAPVGPTAGLVGLGVIGMAAARRRGRRSRSRTKP